MNKKFKGLKVYNDFFESRISFDSKLLKFVSPAKQILETDAGHQANPKLM